MLALICSSCVLNDLQFHGNGGVDLGEADPGLLSSLEVILLDCQSYIIATRHQGRSSDPTSFPAYSVPLLGELRHLVAILPLNVYGGS